MFVNVRQVGLTAIITFTLHDQKQKTIPNCDVLFANSALH